MHWSEKVYALYVGEQNMCDGTLIEIAQKTGKNVESLRWMTYPSYEKRLSKRKTNKITLLVLIEEDEEEIS